MVVSPQRDVRLEKNTAAAPVATTNPEGGDSGERTSKAVIGIPVASRLAGCNVKETEKKPK